MSKTIEILIEKFAIAMGLKIVKDPQNGKLTFFEIYGNKKVDIVSIQRCHAFAGFCDGIQGHHHKFQGPFGSQLPTRPEDTEMGKALGKSGITMLDRETFLRLSDKALHGNENLSDIDPRMESYDHGYQLGQGARIPVRDNISSPEETEGIIDFQKYKNRKRR